jgi:hypothetical protein
MNKNVVYGLLTLVALLMLQWSIDRTNRELEAIYGHPCMLGVTPEAYALLQPGMSESEVEAIIGRVAQERSGTKVWQDGKKTIFVKFENGHFAGKRQTGLK